MKPSVALIAQAAEQVCARLGLDAEAERAVALAVEIATGAPVAPIRGLTPGESQVLRVLALAGDRGIPSATLTEAVRFAGYASLQTAVSRIRRRRPDLGARIETVYGIGYRWTGSAPDGAAVRP